MQKVHDTIGAIIPKQKVSGNLLHPIMASDGNKPPIVCEHVISNVLLSFPVVLAVQTASRNR